jgi:hypothetical protein
MVTRAIPDLGKMIREFSDMRVRPQAICGTAETLLRTTTKEELALRVESNETVVSP